jgi:hypothetical protein
LSQDESPRASSRAADASPATRLAMLLLLIIMPWLVLIALVALWTDLL